MEDEQGGVDNPKSGEHSLQIDAPITVVLLSERCGDGVVSSGIQCGGIILTPKQ